MIIDNIVSWGLKQKASLTNSSQCDETTLVETNHKPATVIFQLKQQPSSWSADVRHTGLIISYYYVGETGYRDNKES